MRFNEPVTLKMFSSQPKKPIKPDALDVLVDVKEGPTGTFQVGGGFSSGDGLVFTPMSRRKTFRVGGRA